MGNPVDLDQLTEAEGRALVRYVQNRVAEQELSESAERLGTSIEGWGQLAKGTRDARDSHARAWLDTIAAAQRAGRLQEPALLYLKVMAIDRVEFYRSIHEGHSPEFAALESALEERMTEVRVKHDLPEWAWWPPGEGPPDAEELTREQMRLHDRRLVHILREFGLFDEAKLLEKDPAEFHRRCELGRRASVEGLSDVEVTDALREQLYKEARASALMAAYHAAAAMVGAATEAALLSRCLRSADSISDVVKQLPRRQRPKTFDPRCWQFSEMCRVADRAGWLPDFQVGEFKLTGDGLINMVRELRNMIHPAKQLRQATGRRHSMMVVKPQYEDALSAYELLVRHLSI